MNQARKRTGTNKVLSMILVLVMLLSLLSMAAFTPATAANSGNSYDYNIMFLDCGRKYFSVDSIKKIIDNASDAGFNYIQLAVGNDGLRFLLDDMSLTVNGTTYTSEQVSSAIHAGNEAYYNFDVDELTETEMDTIIAYAASKGMGVIPCVNTPGHMDAILSAANSLTGENCSYNGSVRTINVTNDTAKAFTQALLQKYINYFAGKGCQLFNMGADEYANDIYTGGSMGFGNLQESGNYRHYVNYVNDVAAMIKHAGMKPMAFNDGIYFNGNISSGTFDTDIIICYWSNGWSGYSPMSASDLASKGFRLVNTNGSYYWVLGKSDAQCDANKASGFDKDSFSGNSTISNPAGSMFCIWADYPGAESEADVISKTADTIAAFGNTLPAVNKVETVEPETVTQGDVAVTAPGLTRLTVTEATAPTIDTAAEGKVSAYDVTPATEKGSYAGSGSVSLPVPDGWDASRVRGYVVNGDGSVTTGLTGTIAYDKFTFTVPHFSKMGIYELAANAATETKEITLTVGGTKTETLAGDYSGTQLNDNIATVTGSVTDTPGKPTYQLATLGAGTFYVSTKSDDAAPTVQLTFEDAGNGQYYIKDSAGQYVYPKARFSLVFGWSYSLGSGKETVNVTNSGNKIVISKEIETSIFNTTAYLTLNGTEYSASDSAKDLYLYKQQTTPGGKETTLTFTGKSAGTTTVTIGNVKYNITVTAEDLSKVTPLTIEYWITNSTLKGNDGKTQYTIQASDSGVASEAGVATAGLVAKDANKDGRTQEYWQTKLLDTTKKNSSTSGTEAQTGESGDDETQSGSTFTKVRYWGGAWQVFTTDWVTVKNTDQLVAYYMEVISITNNNGAENLHVNAADWGTKGDGTGNWGYTPESSRCSVSVQLVYEDGSTSPSGTTANELKSKTIVYGYWDGGRGLGTMVFNGKDNYQIFKVTAETGKMYSTAAAGNTVTVTNFTWQSNEETVWEGAATDSVSIGNPARNASYDPPYDNLAWNTTDHNHNNAILIRVYVKSIPKAGALTVNYFVQGNADPFYHYAINVAENTTFDAGFARKENPNAPGKAELVNNTVINYDGEKQTVQSDLSKMTEIGAQYRYSDYTFVSATRSDDGKTVNLYYTFKAEKTFVIDFGLPLEIHPTDVHPDLQGVTITKVDIANQSTYANINADANGVITYTLNQRINGADTFSVYYHGYRGTGSADKLQYTITVIPATSVYYEDSFATFTNGTGKAAAAKWTTDTDGTPAKATTTQALTELGKMSADAVYGYDNAYADSTKLSMGSAHKVTVSANMVDDWTDGSAWPSATFTFKGTGFDVISLTDNNSGMISVKVYAVGSDGTETLEKAKYVNNYYGYECKDGVWTVNNSANNALYQIPVIKVDDLAYGTHKVVITTAYASYADKTGDSQYSFWLDAIRVYDPMGKDNATYTKDGEGYPQYIKLRDQLAKENGSVTTNDKLLFIDGAEKAEIATYANYGPNNEVYLAKGQAITFTVPGDANIASVQIGAKAPNGSAAQMVVTGGNGLNQELSTATEMYYEIGTEGRNFTIANNGNGILSLTNLKITFTDKPDSTIALTAPTAEEQTAAVMSVRALFAAPEQTFEPEHFTAKWSRNVRKGGTATLTVKASADVESITVNGEEITVYTTKTARSFWGAKETYHVFTYRVTNAATADYSICALNGEGAVSDPITATLTVRPSIRDWWNGIFDKWKH